MVLRWRARASSANNNFCEYPQTYPASRGYIFAVGAGVRKVASTDNRSIFYRACAKFDTRFASKINRESVVKWHEFGGNKKIALTLICYARLAQCSKPVKNRKKPVFLIYSSRFLDRFERLSAEATFRTPANTAKM